MEIRRLLFGRRFPSIAFKLIVGTTFFIFAFALFVRNGSNDDVIDVVITDVIDEPQSPSADVKNASSVTTHFIAAKFISDFYQEEGIPYDNYCQGLMLNKLTRLN
jgi:hypothetical protein